MFDCTYDNVVNDMMYANNNKHPNLQPLYQLQLQPITQHESHNNIIHGFIANLRYDTQ